MGILANGFIRSPPLFETGKPARMLSKTRGCTELPSSYLKALSRFQGMTDPKLMHHIGIAGRKGLRESSSTQSGGRRIHFRRIFSSNGDVAFRKSVAQIRKNFEKNRPRFIRTKKKLGKQVDFELLPHQRGRLSIAGCASKKNWDLVYVSTAIIEHRLTPGLAPAVGKQLKIRIELGPTIQIRGDSMPPIGSPH